MRLTFVTGSSVRRVLIEGRLIKFISPETGFQPVTLNLDMLNSKETKKAMNNLKMTKRDRKDIKILATLNSEEAIANDITKDFQKTGWRLTNKEDGIVN